MTKAFIKFPPTRRSYLPNPVGRRFGYSPSTDHHSRMAFKTDAELATERKAEADALVERIKTQTEQQLQGRATAQQVNDILAMIPKDLKDLPVEQLRALADPNDGVMAKLVAQGLEIQALKAAGSQNRELEDISVRGQIKRWLEGDINPEDKTKGKVIDAVRAIKSGTKRDLPALEIRVASPMSVATVNSGTSPYIGRFEIEPGVNELVRARPIFWDFVVKGRTGAPTYVWVNKYNPLGAAAFIGPGVAKPGISFELVAETSIAKKIADSLKATTELLEDIDGMATFIEQELRYQVMIKVNSTLMTGVNSSTVPAGIQTLSVAYTNTDIKTTNPTYMDAIRAVVGQLRSGWLEGDITVFVNSVDAANMDLSKAQDSGVYLLPPFTTGNGQTIAGARVIEDNNVPVGYVQAGFMRYYRILIYKDFTVYWGWENDDFTKNLITVIGEMRLHQFFNTQYTGAFVYDSFADIITAITEAPAP